MTSRVARKPITVPSGVDLKADGADIKVKGPKGEMLLTVHPACQVNIVENEVTVGENAGMENSKALSGTMRALLNNYITGVSEGFTRKLTLVGVGYRAKALKKGQLHAVDLTLGLSHPVQYVAPEGVEITTPSATEIEIKGCDKQKIGQVAAEIRAYRPPEPYKGKGIRYADEEIILKETKKK